MGREFFNLYRHDFARVAVAVPQVRLAEPAANAANTAQLMTRAAADDAALVVFPELGMTGYTCDDLFQQQALLDQALEAVAQVREHSRELALVTVIGAPLQIDGLLFNCAFVIGGGRLLGVVPKTYLPNYREFYELRQFCPSTASRRTDLDVLGQRAVPFGPQLLFRWKSQPQLTCAVELCEDLWVPIPPSSWAAMAGATVLLNLSASNATVGKDRYRHELVSNQSARCFAAYLLAGAGDGESTTDLAWDGHAVVYENGELLAESERFNRASKLVVAEIDLGRLTQERMRQTSFGQAVAVHGPQLDGFRTVEVDLELPIGKRLPLTRPIDRFAYVPAASGERAERCSEVYGIQVQGLVQRLRATAIERLVVGVSGGLDSTQALIVAVRAMDALGLPRSNVIACTMPGFATSDRTLTQARDLMQALGVEALEIDIKPSCRQLLADIGHPFASGVAQYDVTFENVQAGERTNHLFRLANLRGGLVVGTGDLSELALGWCTYGVGDHMSHYAVNASVPKTLIRHLIRWVADSDGLGADASAVLRRVLDTVVSPELVPAPAAADQPEHSTEALLGPYELHDFFLYYVLRFGCRPSKVAFLAHAAWADRERGRWPPSPVEERNAYSIGDIKRHLRTFLDRFFRASQFKRSAMPNAPKVGSGGSLSPRGDYRAPSDSSADVWLRELETVPDSD